MKKLFISQPMRGKTDEEILAVRAQAKHEVEASLMEKVVVIDSFIQGAPADAKPLWYLGKSLELLSTADIAYFAKGWEEARGCRIEHECAEEYGGIWIVTYETMYKVMCEDCGAEVGEFATPERSIEAWNRRVSDVHSGQRTEKRD